jgi:hypothetical protein
VQAAQAALLRDRSDPEVAGALRARLSVLDEAVDALAAELEDVRPVGMAALERVRREIGALRDAMARLSVVSAAAPDHDGGNVSAR